MVSNMYKIISFSVWGNDKKYLQGCYENIHLAKEIYPGWQTRFYCASNMDESFYRELLRLGAELTTVDIDKNSWEGLFWRFMPAFEDNVDIFISRDTDSRLNYREKAAVDEWLASDKDIHCMRDHVEHNVPMLGGMWGCRNKILHDLHKQFSEWQEREYKGSDQDFLRNVVFENYRDKIICHDRFYQGFARINGIFREPYDRPNLVFDLENKIDVEYHYIPLDFFGSHDIRSFPVSDTHEINLHVGQIYEI